MYSGRVFFKRKRRDLNVIRKVDDLKIINHIPVGRVRVYGNANLPLVRFEFEINGFYWRTVTFAVNVHKNLSWTSETIPRRCSNHKYRKLKTSFINIYGRIFQLEQILYTLYDATFP